MQRDTVAVAFELGEEKAMLTVCGWGPGWLWALTRTPGATTSSSTTGAAFTGR